MTTRVPDEMLEGGGGGGGGGSALPPGTILEFAGATAPAGYLLCSGQLVSRTTYAALFDAIGIVFGAGDGSTTFAVPDRRGRIGLGKDNMGGVPANRVTSAVSGVVASALGAAGGDQRLHAHTHGVTDPGHFHTGGVSGSAVVSSGPGDTFVGEASSTASATTGVSINTAGAGGSQNIPPVLVLNYIIKT